MFTWFKNWFSNKDSFDVYSPKEKLLYKYFNGKKYLSADPIVIYKRIMEVGPSLSVDIKVARSQSKDALTAHNKMIKTIRDIFELDPKDGLDEASVCNLLDHFLVYCETVKKNSSVFAMPSTVSEDSKTILQEDLPTSNSADSGSTEKEIKTDDLSSSTKE